MIAYINRKNLEVLFIPDDEDYMRTDGQDLWEDTLKTIESWENPIVIEKMESWEAFRIMEDFIETLSDHHMQWMLESALKKRRPFAHFKAIVETSEYRQIWFDYRDKQDEKYVRENLSVEILLDIEEQSE